MLREGRILGRVGCLGEQGPHSSIPNRSRKINKIFRSEMKEWGYKEGCTERVDGWMAGDIGLLAALAKAMLL